MEFARNCVIWIALFVSPVSAYPSGAPPRTCDDMTPQHGSSSQTSDAPYTLVFTFSCYNVNTKYNLTLQGESSAQFAGFFIQARKGGIRLGTFQAVGGTSKTVECDETTEDAITHVSASLKSHVVVTWISPSTDVGQIFFTYTVVANFSTFWVMINSSSFGMCTPNTDNWRAQYDFWSDQFLRGAKFVSAPSLASLLGDPLTDEQQEALLEMQEWFQGHYSWRQQYLLGNCSDIDPLDSIDGITNSTSLLTFNELVQRLRDMATRDYAEWRIAAQESGIDVGYAPEPENPYELSNNLRTSLESWITSGGCVNVSDFQCSKKDESLCSGSRPCASYSCKNDSVCIDPAGYPVCICRIGYIWNGEYCVMEHKDPLNSCNLTGAELGTDQTTSTQLNGNSTVVPENDLDGVAPLAVVDLYNVTDSGQVNVSMDYHIAAIKVIPPQNSRIDDVFTYSPDRDYSIIVSCNLQEVMVKIHRPGIYNVIVAMVNGEVYRFVVIYDTYFPNPDCSYPDGVDNGTKKDKTCDINFGLSVLFGVLRRFKCPAAGPVQVVSADVAGQIGLRGRTRVATVDEIIGAVTAQVDTPVDLVIVSHGNEGFFKIGPNGGKFEYVSINNMIKFCNGLKGKVTSVRIFACKVAQGPAGRQFVDCLSKCLGNGVIVEAWRHCLWPPTRFGKERWYTFTGFLAPYRGRAANCKLRF